MELSLNGTTKQFGHKTAVNDFSFTMTSGVYGLLGANGAGKTTLMRLLCGVQTPTSGTISYGGKNIRSLGERYSALLGYLPQHFGYYPDFSAYDFLLYIAALKGIQKQKASRKAKEILEAVGLMEVKGKKIKTFSGGMKQRLGIAQAMLNDPCILVLDEPTAGLDPKERVRFRNLISTFSKDRIVLLSTHIVSDVEYIADDILIMKSGKLLRSGNPEMITAEIDGYVWECTVPVSHIEKYSSMFNIGNIRSTDSSEAIFRIISDKQPLPNAKAVHPNLEDLYLFYFKEDAQSV